MTDPVPTLADTEGDMRGSRSRIWWSRGAVVAITLACVALAVSPLIAGETRSAASGELAWSFVACLFAWLGGLIIEQQRNGRIGWLLVFIGGAFAYGSLIERLVDRVDPIATPWTWLVLWLGNWAWLLWLFPVVLLLLILPTGRLLSPRWKWAPILMAVMTAVFLFLSAFGRLIGPQTGPHTWRIRNPIGFIGDLADILLIPWSVGLFALVGGGLVAMVMRYRLSLIHI